MLVEPETIRRLKKNTGEDLAYILHTQLREADLIVLNKQDLLTPEELTDALDFLAQTYPQAKRLSISALTGEGLVQLRQAMLEGNASLQRPDIGYGGPDFSRAMGVISEYYIQYYATVCCDDFDGTAYLHALAEAVRQGIREQQGEIPHLKLLAWEPEGDYGKVDLIDVYKRQGDGSFLPWT